MRTAHSVLRLVFILSSLAQDALQFLLLGTRSGAAIKAENMFLRKQLALSLEREGQASAGDRRYTVVSGPSLSALRMARRSGERQAGDLPRLASEGFSVALAMEIEAAWKAPSARATPGTDLQDGAQESDVGRGAHRR